MKKKFDDEAKEIRIAISYASFMNSLIYQFDPVDKRVPTKYDQENLYDVNKQRYYPIEMWDGMWIHVEEKDFYKSS